MSSDKEFEKWWENNYRFLNNPDAKLVALKAFSDQQSKLDTKDEILRELVKQLNKDVGDMNCIELGRWYAENDKLLNKPEIKQLRGE